MHKAFQHSTNALRSSFSTLGDASTALINLPVQSKCGTPNRSRCSHVRFIPIDVANAINSTSSPIKCTCCRPRNTGCTSGSFAFWKGRASQNNMHFLPQLYNHVAMTRLIAFNLAPATQHSIFWQFGYHHQQLGRSSRIFFKSCYSLLSRSYNNRSVLGGAMRVGVAKYRGSPNVVRVRLTLTMHHPHTTRTSCDTPFCFTASKCTSGSRLPRILALCVVINNRTFACSTNSRSPLANTAAEYASKPSPGSSSISSGTGTNTSRKAKIEIKAINRSSPMLWSSIPAPPCALVTSKSRSPLSTLNCICSSLSANTAEYRAAAAFSAGQTLAHKYVGNPSRETACKQSFRNPCCASKATTSCATASTRAESSTSLACTPAIATNCLL